VRPGVQSTVFRARSKTPRSSYVLGLQSTANQYICGRTSSAVRVGSPPSSAWSNLLIAWSAVSLMANRLSSDNQCATARIECIVNAFNHVDADVCGVNADESQHMSSMLHAILSGPPPTLAHCREDLCRESLP
jgi:hypothetical protein